MIDRLLEYNSTFSTKRRYRI